MTDSIRPTIALRDLEAVVDVNGHDFVNWDRRGLLRTEYASTIPGRARRFTRENAIELAVVAAMARNSVPVPAAVAYADMVVRNADQRTLREFLVFATGNVSSATSSIGTNELSADLINTVAQAAGATTMSVSVVCMGEIVRRIDALFPTSALPAKG